MAVQLRLVVLLLVAGSAAAQPAPYIVVPQPLPGDIGLDVTGVSGDGRRVVGRSAESWLHSRIVVWDDLGAPIAITPAGEDVSFGYISGDGSMIIGTLETSIGGLITPMAARWDADVVSLFTPDGYPDGLPGYLIGVSASGRLLGYANQSSQHPGPFVSDGTQIEPIDLPPGAESCLAEEISDDGSTWVGSCFLLANPYAYVPVRWSERGGLQVAYLSETKVGTATDVSADGSVVVGSAYDGGGRRPFVWTGSTGFRFLEDVLEASGVDTTGVTLNNLFAVYVSADGRTVGGGKFIARLPEPVPEPGSLSGAVAALLAVALERGAEIGSTRRRNGRDALPRLLEVTLAEGAETVADFPPSSGAER